MKTTPIKKALAILLSLIGLLPVSLTTAASLSLVVTPAHPRIADPAYPGSGSTITTATHTPTGVSVSVAGRNYGVDPAAGATRWGLRSGPTAWDASKSGFIVTNGFTPAAVGSRNDRNGNAASYVSITFGNVQPNTLFQDLSIDFNGLVFTRATNAWAAASVGGFDQWSLASQTNSGANGRKVSVTLPDFVWTGGDALEVRLYGIAGADEGAFANVRLTARMTAAPPVPEPAPLAFVALAAAWLVRRRRS